MSAFTDGAYGTGKRLSATGFLALGLITFWVYTVLRFAASLDEHFRRRWTDLSLRHDLSGVEPAALTRFRTSGFAVNLLPPRIAAVLFALCALLVAWGFVSGVWGRGEFTYQQMISVVGLASTLFFAATLIFMLWALDAIRRHEMGEVLLYEAGAAAFQAKPMEPGGTLVTRWEGHASNMVLFIVLALPIAFSPTLGVHLFLTGGAAGHEVLLPTLCFLLAGVFHVWGTMLLVSLYNDHLAFEAAQAAVASGAWPSPAPVVASEQTGNATMTPSRELAAIMLTDMAGYSRAMERDEAQAYARLIRHNEIMRAAIGAHSGREIKTIGDAFLVIFKSAIDAVDCALTAQRAFADFNHGKSEDERILVRIGIHIGDVLVTHDDVFGDGVNVTARIEPHAEPGGICISEPVFEMVRKKLQLDVSRVEGASLKNIAVAPDLYRIRLGS